MSASNGQVVAIGANHREYVPGNLVVLGEKRGLNDAQQVTLAMLHVEHEALLNHTGAVAKVSKLPDKW